MGPNDRLCPEHGRGEVSRSRSRIVTTRVVPVGAPRCPQTRYSAAALPTCRSRACTAAASEAGGRRPPPERGQHDDAAPGRAAERPRRAARVLRAGGEAPPFSAEEGDGGGACFDRPRARGPAVAAAVVHDQPEVAEA